MELDDAWTDIRVGLSAAVGPRTYGLWLEPLRCAGLREDTLHLTGPPEVCAWAADRLGAVLRMCVSTVLGPGIDVDVRPEPLGPAAPTNADPRPDTGSLNPKYNFEQFVIGPSNRLAHAAALAVA